MAGILNLSIIHFPTEEEDLMFVSLTVSLLSVSGIPCPTEQDISQNGMLARKVDYTYYVDYDFLPDKLAEGTELQGVYMHVKHI